VPIVLKSGSLKLLERLGPVQAYAEIALPLPLPLLFFINYIRDRMYDVCMHCMDCMHCALYALYAPYALYAMHILYALYRTGSQKVPGNVV
jgi:hypothetical protein